MSRQSDLLNIARGIMVALVPSLGDDAREVDIVLAACVAIHIAFRVDQGANMQAECLSFQTLMERLATGLVEKR